MTNRELGHAANIGTTLTGSSGMSEATLLARHALASEHQKAHECVRAHVGRLVAGTFPTTEGLKCDAMFYADMAHSTALFADEQRAIVDEARAERDALAQALQAWSWMWEYSTGEDYNQDVAHAESLTAPALAAYYASRKARP